MSSSQILTPGVQKLLYDYEHLRVRFDVQGWRAQQNETYMLKYKPEGAETDSVSKKQLAKQMKINHKFCFFLASFTGLYNV